MKAVPHAVAGVGGFVIIVSSMLATLSAMVLGTRALASIQPWSVIAIVVLIPMLAGAGATGMSMLGKRTEPMALTKQLRGPRAFMTSLFVLLPSAIFLWWRSSGGVFDGLFYGVQAIEWVASGGVAVLIGLNIRDGLALRGRIATGGTGASIQPRDGGPLVVMNVSALTETGGTSLQVNRVMALCRCGQSKGKPFCDGTHNTFGFDTSVSQDRSTDAVLKYEGEHLDIHYNRLLCSHAAECGKRQKAAFDSSRDPWIVPDNASREGLLDVVKACPSGALRYSLPGEEPQQILQDESGVTVEENGPYRVAGIVLEGARLAQGATQEKYVLCRCGASKNKPYCDGSHVDIGWKSV